VPESAHAPEEMDSVALAESDHAAEEMDSVALAFPSLETVFQPFSIR
jgi:hypothetical protein